MVELPKGTVTFLFTDIEGSTTRWEQHPAAMRAALARHDALLHRGITAHGGVVLTERGEGDSFFALFARPSDALAAACAVQRALVAESWPGEVAPIRVRMALHSGEAGMWEGRDYRGAAVNRCARLRAAAHGNQIILSGATYELVRDVLPPEAGLRDLGAHRLKDLTRPEHIWYCRDGPVLPRQRLVHLTVSMSCWAVLSHRRLPDELGRQGETRLALPAQFAVAGSAYRPVCVVQFKTMSPVAGPLPVFSPSTAM